MRRGQGRLRATRVARRALLAAYPPCTILCACLPSQPRADVPDTMNNVLRAISLTGVNESEPWGAVTVLAGDIGGASFTDGIGSIAGFSSPASLAYVDFSGDSLLYVADTINNLLRMVTLTDGANVVTRVAGGQGTSNNIGSANGAGSAAGFSGPLGVCTAVVAGNLVVFVADTGNKLMRKVANSTGAPGIVPGMVTAYAGGSVNSATPDGAGTSASFYAPNSCVWDGASRIFVVDGLFSTGAPFSDANAYSTIRAMDISNPAAGWVTTIAGKTKDNSFADGEGTNAKFDNPLA